MQLQRAAHEYPQSQASTSSNFQPTTILNTFNPNIKQKILTVQIGLHTQSFLYAKNALCETFFLFNNFFQRLLSFSSSHTHFVLFNLAQNRKVSAGFLPLERICLLEPLCN